MIPIYEPSFFGREREYVSDCVDKVWVSSQGEYVTSLESALADYHSVKHGVVTSNCTTALHLALLAVGVGPGDEVLCPDLTFIAPANMIKLTGAEPVLVDIDPVTLTIDPLLAEKKISNRTKAIIIVHQFGHAADMDPIMKLAAAHDLKVIEDNAESIGASYKGRMLGTIGDVATFSFFGNKIITTGEGGGLITNDEQINARARMLRDHGMNPNRRYEHLDLGFNYRMTNLQAALGVAQVEKLDEILAIRQQQLESYESALSAIGKITTRKFANWCNPVHWLMTVHANDQKMRDYLITELANEGVECRPMVNPVHEAKHFVEHYDPAEFEHSIGVSRRSFHLPSGANLTAENIQYISEALEKVLNTYD